MHATCSLPLKADGLRNEVSEFSEPMKGSLRAVSKHANGDLQSRMLMWTFPHSDRKKLVQLWLVVAVGWFWYVCWG